jgi:hypothetical protein
MALKSGTYSILNNGFAIGSVPDVKPGIFTLGLYGKPHLSKWEITRLPNGKYHFYASGYPVSLSPNGDNIRISTLDVPYEWSILHVSDVFAEPPRGPDTYVIVADNGLQWLLSDRTGGPGLRLAEIGTIWVISPNLSAGADISAEESVSAEAKVIVV